MQDLVTFLTNLLSFDQEHPLLFTQFNFWAFFLLVFALYAAILGVGRGRRAMEPARHADGTPRMPRARRLLRNGYLTLVSLFFYYKTSGLFVLLLVLSIFVGWLIGVRMDRLALGADGKGDHPGRRKAWMVAGVTLNLAILCYFKYAYFFTDIYNTMFSTHNQVVNHLALWANHFTAQPRFDASQILLPVGISFFTFQNISYIVDVYQRKVPHASHVLDFGFYTTFFPQLVAGPIVRAQQFVPQLYKPYSLTRRQFGIALFWVLNGLAKKIILSDYLAVNFVDRVFNNPLLFTPFENVSALFVYSLQVYADFSGYTDIAIGTAMMMGFYLPLNFNSPYKATNCAGFWKRWHISLSNWLKDYLYIPMGGNRNATAASWLVLFGLLAAVALMAKTAWVTLLVSSLVGLLLAIYILFPKHRKEYVRNVNNMDTMLLGGLWHGASFNFITWGGLNGLGILIYKYWKKLGPWWRVASTALLWAATMVARGLWPSPALNMFAFAFAVLFAGTALRYLLFALRGGRATGWLETGWNVLVTFSFISFTRLFFRSGSNLHPAEANEVAWRTATQMVSQIGSVWHGEHIVPILRNYLPVFLLFAAGMVVHWLPERLKRRYRLWFAHWPLWLMLLAAVAAVFVIQQFVTADLQPFIYFQF